MREANKDRYFGMDLPRERSRDSIRMLEFELRFGWDRWPDARQLLLAAWILGKFCMDTMGLLESGFAWSDCAASGEDN